MALCEQLDEQTSEPVADQHVRRRNIAAGKNHPQVVDGLVARARLGRPIAAAEAEAVVAAHQAERGDLALHGGPLTARALNVGLQDDRWRARAGALEVQ